MAYFNFVSVSSTLQLSMLQWYFYANAGAKKRLHLTMENHFPFAWCILIFILAALSAEHGKNRANDALNSLRKGSIDVSELRERW